MAKRKKELTDEERLASAGEWGKQLMRDIEDRIYSSGAVHGMDMTAIEQAKKEGAVNILKSSFENRFKPGDQWMPEVMDKAINNATEAYNARTKEMYAQAKAHQEAERQQIERGLAMGGGTAYEAAFVSVGPEGKKHPIPIEWLT